MKMSFFLECRGFPSGDRRSPLQQGPVAPPAFSCLVVPFQGMAVHRNAPSNKLQRALLDKPAVAPIEPISLL